MANDSADGSGTELTLLGSSDAIDEDRLAQLYSYPDSLEKCCVRANFISSLDGGATTDGKSGGLAGPGDRSLFLKMRELADVIVVGAGTVRVENYSGASLSVAQRQGRQARGQAEVPPIAVVTQSGSLDSDMLLFTHTEVPPLVLTSSSAVERTVERLAGAAEVLDCSASDPGVVDMGALLTVLGSRGLLRVLTEGGPTLLGSFIEADLLDELCLSIAPVVVGGQARRISSGHSPVLTELRRSHLLTDEAGYLYTRYTR